MDVTVCGHASLLVQTTKQTILIDPIFDDNLKNGAVVYAPAREYDASQLPELTAVVVTHGHFDHFHKPTLSKLSREVPIVTAEDDEVLEWLRAEGFSDITVLPDWGEHSIGDVHLVATPSAHEEPEFGLLVKHDDCVFWHMADAEVTPAMSKTVLERAGHVDLISVKYQPVVRASMGLQRNHGTAFDKDEVIEWLETACVCEPKLAFPYASGVAFGGRHAWFNRYALPLSAEEVAELLAARLGGPERGAALMPGDRVKLTKDAAPQVERQTAGFVRVVDKPMPRWEPVDTSTLFGIEDAAARAATREKLDAMLGGDLAAWLASTAETGWAAHWRKHHVRWQLYVHAGDDAPWAYYLDFTDTDDFVAKPGELERANYFSHISGLSLEEVLDEKQGGALFFLTGGARSYEKILYVRDGAIRAMPLPAEPEDSITDPLCYFLRYRGSTPQTTEQHGGDVLARAGENEAVLRKKVLLGLLALEAAERDGCLPSKEQVMQYAAAFRMRYGLQDEQTTRDWLKQMELSDAEILEIMREFAAIEVLEQRHAERIDQRLPARQRLSGFGALAKAQ